ncbi:MAG: LytTR family DNA-binding domain-containing protein [Clostridiales bacterium]
MKLGLICNDKIRNNIIKEIESLHIELFQDADIFIVEEGLHNKFNPCIVFNSNDIKGLVKILTILSPNISYTKIVGLQNDEYCMIDFEKILYFESQNSNVHCHTSFDVFQVKYKLYQLENKLPNSNFIRISKSYIINIDNVVRIIPWFNRRLLLKFEDSKKEVEVSKNYVNQFKQFLGIR